MKVGLFALETGRKVGGLEVYETNLIRALAQIDRENEYVVFCLDRRVPDILGLQANNFEFCVLPTNRLRGVLWDVPRAMAKAKLDLFHAMFVPPPFTSVPYVFTHHGVDVIERPHFYPLALGLRMRVLFRRAFDKSSLILCVSEYVRHYLANQHQLPAEKLRTVYLGCGPEFRSINKSDARRAVAVKYALTEPYILVVGRIEPIKNPVRVLKAYERFRRAVAAPPRLVFAGMKTWSASEFDRTINEFGLQALISQIGHVPHEDLPSLYAASEFSVFASLGEGFGLPVVEALAARTPLITSRVASLPEVAGEACLLVDPYNPEEIAAAMQALHCDRQLQEQLIQRGFARASEFSWERTARETADAYRKTARKTKERRA